MDIITSSTPTKKYTRPIRKGFVTSQLTDKNGNTKTVRRARDKGMVVANLVGSALTIGWTLCHFQSGDTFDSEFGSNLAQGRSLMAPKDKKSVVFLLSKPPTVQALLQAGIPQTAIPTIQRLIISVAAANQDLKHVIIFATKKQSTQPLYTAKELDAAREVFSSTPW